MTISANDNSVGFKRCAVCKIDLKGRFVYIDDEIETLLGRTKEELFGKSFFDFLHKQSRDQIKQLISNRNHYETCYDTTTVTILSRNQQPVIASIVVNLNFIAGNPVNFQVIINPRETLPTDFAVSDQSQIHSQFVEDLLEIDGIKDFKKFIALLRVYTGASQAAVYKIGENELEPRAAATDDNSAEFTFKSIPQHGQLHLDVAQSGKIYSCLDQNDAQTAVEKYKSAPNEYVSRFAPTGESSYLLRLIFAEKGDMNLVAEAIQRAELGIALFVRLTGNSGNVSDDSDSSLDVKFTIGFLDSLDIGAVLTDRGGKITGYNPAFVRQIGEEDVDGDFRCIVEKLRPFNPEGLIDTILSSIQSPVEESGIEDFRTKVNLSGDKTATLVVVRFSLDPSDLSSCLAFIPSAARAGKSESRNPSNLPWPEILTGIKSVILSINGFSGNLAHQFYSSIGDDGNDSLRCLDDNSRALSRMINDLSLLLEQIDNVDDTELVDLNLAVRHALQDVLGSVPEAKVKCHYKKLPKLFGCRSLLVTVLRNLISNAVRFNHKQETIIKIEAEVEEHHCLLTVSDNGPGIPEIYQSKLFDFFYIVPESTLSPLPGSGSGLAICKQLIEKIGGSINLTSVENKGTTVNIRLPIENSKRDCK